MSEIRFSIIIPVFNGESFIRRAIDSVLSQTYTNYEIIVVNDGSYDKTAEILTSYADTIRVISQNNSGVSSARNNGFKESNGNYIVYLDADDRWLPDKLNIYNATFQEYNVDFIFSELNRTTHGKVDGLRRNGDFFPIIYSAGHKTNDKTIRVFDQKEIIKLICKGYPFYPSTFAIKRKVLETIQWDENFKYSEDLLFSLRCSQFFSFAYIDITLTLIDRHDANASSDLMNMYANDAIAFDIYAREIKNYKIKYQCWLAASSKHLSIFQHYVENGQYNKAIKYFLKAIKIPLFIPRAVKRIISVFLKNHIKSYDK